MSTTTPFTPVKVGIIGCGVICKAYLQGCKTFPAIEVAHLADLDVSRAQALAAEYGIAHHGSVESLLANPEVEIVINLTIPRAHTEVNLAIINAGKHVYCEKPFCLNREEGAEVLRRAAEKGVRVASAPDTFLGSSHQTCRLLIDEGAIGTPVSAVAFCCGHGHEGWHPSPAFYYDIGGGPMFDMGPYYLTALVNLIGPMRRISASTRKTFEERTIGSQPLAGTKIPVHVPTHLAGTIDFQNDAIATVIMSFDIWAANHPRIEIYGTEGTLSVPDPNQGSGPIQLKRAGDKEWTTVEDRHTKIAARGGGVADLAYAIRSGRAHRANGDMALHVVDAMQSFEESSTQGCHRILTTTCERPALVPTDVEAGTFDA